MITYNRQTLKDSDISELEKQVEPGNLMLVSWVYWNGLGVYFLLSWNKHFINTEILTKDILTAKQRDKSRLCSGMG